MKTKTAAAVCLLTLALLGAGCQSLFAKPSHSVEKFYRHVEAGELDEAAALIAQSSSVAGLGPTKIKAALAKMTADLKNRQGIDSFEFKEEDIRGDVAVVRGTVTYGNGSTENFEMNLIKEDGVWKMSK